MLPAESSITVWSTFVCGVSLFALVFAFRGRRIGDHPVCRRCGFDLFGLPPTSQNCPECGGDLNRKRAIRIGRRAMRKRVFAAAMVLLVAGAGWLGFVGVLAARHENWNQRKPVSWLIRDATVPRTRDAAITELMARLGKNKLDDNQTAEIADVGLRHQANLAEPWFVKWGLFIEAAHNAKRLSPERWHRYLQQALDSYDLEVRSEVRREQSIPFRITRLPARGGPGFMAGLTPSRPIFHVDGQVMRIVTATGSTERNKFPYEGLVDLAPAEVMKLEPGEHQAGITINFGTLFPARTQTGEARYPYQTRVVRTFYITAQNESRVELHYDAAVEAQVEAAISVQVSSDQRAGVMTVIVNSSGAPVNVAFRGQLSSKGLERDLGFILFPAYRSGKAEILLRDVLQAWDPEKVTIRLIPNIDGAECTLDMKEIWGGQVTRHDVQVARRYQ
jgi:hypothetical protein